MAHKLTLKAEDDIIHIYLEGLRLFGAAQAETYHGQLETIFQLLSDNPNMARERSEINPPIRIHPYKAHLIVYMTDDRGDIVIVRIRHAHEDWESTSIG